MADRPLFNQDQLRALTDATRRTKKLRRCVGVATFGGWTTGAFGGFTLLGALPWFAWSSVFIGAALLVVAWGELHGASLIRGFDPRGPRRLAMNQVFLGAALFVYAAWSLACGLRGGASASGNPDVDAMVDGITRAATIGVYGSLMVFAVVGPGLTAWYYASRGRLIREFRQSTEPSVIEALRAA